MAGEQHVMCETALKSLRGWQASADEDILTYDTFKNRKLENFHNDVQDLYTSPNNIWIKSRRWDASEMRCVWERWEKHAEF
jgi:hypothetical protein